MADTPEIHILPVDTLPVVDGFSYNLTRTKGSLPESAPTVDDAPQIQIIASNVVNESTIDDLILIGSVTAAEIKIAYESNPDTNSYTDLDKLIVSTISGALAAEIIARYDSDIVIYNTMSEVRQSIPIALYQLLDDSTHRLVTDSEKEIWNEKIGPMDIIDGGLF